MRAILTLQLVCFVLAAQAQTWPEYETLEKCLAGDSAPLYDWMEADGWEQVATMSRPRIDRRGQQIGHQHTARWEKTTTVGFQSFFVQHYAAKEEHLDHWEIQAHFYPDSTGSKAKAYDLLPKRVRRKLKWEDKLTRYSAGRQQAAQYVKEPILIQAIDIGPQSGVAESKPDYYGPYGWSELIFHSFGKNYLERMDIYQW